MVRIIGACRLLLVTLSIGSAPAFGQAADQTAMPPATNQWAIGCTPSSRSAPLDCSLSQEVIEANTGRLLAMVRIRVPGDTKSPVMLVQVPLAVYLPGAVTLSVDGATPTTIAFQTCDADGCYAGMPVAASFLGALLKGQTLQLGFQNQARQSTLVPISLAGFAKAYADVQ